MGQTFLNITRSAKAQRWVARLDDTRIADAISQRLELPVEVLDPFRNIHIDTKKFDPEYLSEIVPEMAVAVGLAIRGV